MLRDAFEDRVLPFGSRLDNELKVLIVLRLLIIDEIGYLLIERQGRAHSSSSSADATSVGR